MEGHGHEPLVCVFKGLPGLSFHSYPGHCVMDLSEAQWPCPLSVICTVQGGRLLWELASSQVA